MKIILLLLSLFAALGARAQNATCPQPVVCVTDPCDGAQCPRFLNTECRVDACHGECRATFFRLSNGKEVTNRCAAPTCAQTPCPARRTCMNTVVPTTCPRNRPNCRQYIKPKCVLSLQPQPPTDCSQVLCPPDRSFCEVRQTTRGPRARCIPQPPPTSCENVKCEEGMRCRMREREGARPVVRCVPIRVVPVPRNCSELECSDGFMCVFMDGKAMCVETPSPPDECDRLACEERNQECRVVTFFNVSRAICGPISDCSRLSCNESEGLECRVAGEGQMKFAFCARTSNCSKLICNESAGLECRVAGRQIKFAFCARTSNCSKIRCDESQGLECRVVGEGVSAVAVCLITRNCTVLNPICRRRGLVCQEPQDEGDFAQATCVLTSSCEQLKCNLGFTCIEFFPAGGDEGNVGDVSSGSGILPSTVIPPTPTRTSTTFSGERPTAGDGGSGSGTTPTISTSITPVTATSPPIPTPVMALCIANSTQATCGDFPCEEDQVCSLQRYPSRNISIVTCAVLGVAPQRQSCSNNGLETCSGSLCVDLVQDGDQVTFTCVEVNCTQQDRMCSTPGTTCIPASLPAMDFDSVCVQTAVQFELGTDCGGRASACTRGLACQEIQIEGNVVGTICNTPSSPVSCDSVECPSEAECVQNDLNGMPFSAFCASSSILDNSLSMTLQQLQPDMNIA